MAESLRFAHQFNPVIAYGDAVGNDCLELQRIFWSAGVRSDLFAAEAKPEMRALTRSWDDLELITRRDGLLLVHHSIGTENMVGRAHPTAAATAVTLVLFLTATTAGCGLWFAKNWVLAKNPTYPLLYSIFDGRTRTRNSPSAMLATATAPLWKYG